MDYELGIIGGGNMAEAIVRAALEHQIVAADRVIVSDPLEPRRTIFESLGVATTDDNTKLITGAAQVMLAIKPQTLAGLAAELSRIDAGHQIIMSIMAGVRTSKIERIIGRPARIVRIMPNTPLLVGLGMSAIAVGPHAHEGDELLAVQLFRAAGEAITVDEEALDAVTAVSGSGPAYVFYLAEAMMEAAHSLGLSQEHAALLTQQTILGAAMLMKESDDPPAELRRKVTSPGGTTQAAIEHVQSQKVSQHIIDAIARAAQRSRELGA